MGLAGGLGLALLVLGPSCGGSWVEGGLGLEGGLGIPVLVLRSPCGSSWVEGGRD